MAFHESGEMVTHRTSSSLLSSIKKGKLEGCREKLCIPRPINVHMKRSSLFVFFFVCRNEITDCVLIARMSQE